CSWALLLWRSNYRSVILAAKPLNCKHFLRFRPQIRPSWRTASRSSSSSAAEASMRERDHSSISRSGTISHSPPEQVHGKEDTSPSGTPYDPSEQTAIDTQSPSDVPRNQSRMCPMAALAADAADDAPLAS